MPCALFWSVDAFVKTNLTCGFWVYFPTESFETRSDRILMDIRYATF